MPVDYPFIPGWECSGEVVEAGPGEISQSLKGKRVSFTHQKVQQVPWKVGGAMAEYAVTLATNCIILNDELSFEEGASSQINPLSAIEMVERLKEHKVKTAIITAASSQLGGMLIRLCKTERIQTIATVRRAEQVSSLEADHVINTKDADWENKMKMICTELKPTGCLDCVSGEMVGKMFGFLSFGGLIILYGVLSGENAGSIKPFELITKGIRMEAFMLGRTKTKLDRATLSKKAQDLMKTELKTHVNKIYPLSQFEDAIKFYKAN